MIKSKKIYLYAIILLLLISISLNYIQNEKNTKIKTELNKKPKIFEELNTLNMSTLKSKMDKNQTFIVYIGKISCSDCQKFDPKLISFLKTNNLENNVYYVDISKIRNNKEKWNDFIKTYNIKYTPTIALIKNKHTYKQIGWTPESGINNKSIFKFIKENV